MYDNMMDKIEDFIKEQENKEVQEKIPGEEQLEK